MEQKRLFNLFFSLNSRMCELGNCLMNSPLSPLFLRKPFFTDSWVPALCRPWNFCGVRFISWPGECQKLLSIHHLGNNLDETGVISLWKDAWNVGIQAVRWCGSTRACLAMPWFGDWWVIHLLISQISLGDIKEYTVSP